MKKIAIIGASYLQSPLILKAKEMKYETHVFAWQCGDVGEIAADYFYPISIVEMDAIAEKCREIGIDGICTIATDLGAVTVNYVANKLGLPGNSLIATEKSSNKHKMREAFEQNGDPSPRSYLVDADTDFTSLNLTYPIIVKPTDRSGSRGICKLEQPDGLMEAVKDAMAESFEKKALVEEFAIGQEYSVEYISSGGKHHFLAMTLKYTTGAPHFIETGHLEPAPVSEELLAKVQSVVEHALDSLEIKNSASHSEIKIAADGTIRIIEIGGRMGGDFIGSHLVQLSTGVDFVENVIRIATGQEPVICRMRSRAAAVHFVFSQHDVDVFERLKQNAPELLVGHEIHPITDQNVTDSSNRFGYWIMAADSAEELQPYLPNRSME